MKLFSKKHFSDYSHEKLEILKKHINDRDSFNDNLEKAAQDISQEYQIPLVNFDNKSYTTQIKMQDLPVDYGRGEMSITGRKIIAVVQYSLTASFDQKQQEVLEVRPMNYIDQNNGISSVGLKQGQLYFEIPTDYSNEQLSSEVIEGVVKKRDEILHYIDINISNLNEDIIRLNQTIITEAFESVTDRKNYLDKIKSIHSKL